MRTPSWDRLALKDFWLNFYKRSRTDYGGFGILNRKFEVNMNILEFK